jgi:hypothetical protein
MIEKDPNIKTTCFTFLEGLTSFKILCFKVTIYQNVKNDMIVKTFNKFHVHGTCYMCVLGHHSTMNGLVGESKYLFKLF